MNCTTEPVKASFGTLELEPFFQMPRPVARPCVHDSLVNIGETKGSCVHTFSFMLCPGLLAYSYEAASLLQFGNLFHKSGFERPAHTSGLGRRP